MKRKGNSILSICLALVVILSTMSLSSCAKQEKQTIAFGTWLQMINSTFGMNTYTSSEPLVTNVNTQSEYYGAVQIAAEWNVIDPKEGIDVDKQITWNDALITLVNVAGFAGEDATDKEKVKCGIQKLDSSIRTYWGNREIEYGSAVQLLETAHEQWATKTFDESVYSCKYKDGIKDFSENEEMKEYEVDGDRVTLSYDGSIDIKPGDIYILPENGDNYSPKAYRAEVVENRDGILVIKNSSEELSLYDIAENLQMQSTVKADESNTLFLDANGEVVGSFADIMQSSNVNKNMAVVDCNKEYIASPTSFETELSIPGNKGDWKLKITPSYSNEDGFSLGIGYGYNRKDSRFTFYGNGALKVNNVVATHEIDYSWFKLHSATVKVDYDSEFSIGGEVKYEKDSVSAPRHENCKKLGKEIQNFKSRKWKDINDGGASTINMGATDPFDIKIGSIVIKQIGPARICLDIHMIIDIDGSVTFTVKNENSKGVEYKNGNIRFINVDDKDIDVNLNANIEAVASVGPALYTWGLDRCIIGLHGQVGVGANIDVTLHLADSENHLLEEGSIGSMSPMEYGAALLMDYSVDVSAIKELAESQGKTYATVETSTVKAHLDVCVDVKIYFIVRLELARDCYAKDVLKDVTTTIEFFGKDNATFGHLHFENGPLVGKTFFGECKNDDLCTLEYTPFDDAKDEEGTEVVESETEEGTIIESDQITVNEYKKGLKIGETYYVAIVGLPEGYTVEDLTMTSSDSAIATVSNNGVVIAKSEGSVSLIIKTKDGVHETAVGITVTDPNKITGPHDLALP